jgi:DnaJ-class molecular chaperone
MNKLLIKTFLRSCPRCFGTGTLELPNGSMQDCPVCKGKGMI